MQRKILSSISSFICDVCVKYVACLTDSAQATTVRINKISLGFYIHSWYTGLTSHSLDVYSVSK